MPIPLALGVSVLCFIAGVVLIVTGGLIAGLAVIIVSAVFDVLFVRALFAQRHGRNKR